MSEVKLPVPLEFRRGVLRNDERASVNSALSILKLIGQYADLNGSKFLDFGCGVKLAQGLCEQDDPQGLYVGLDVYGEMIDFLSDALADNPKYHFATVDFQNDMYNENGVPMTPDAKLPIADDQFDIMTMFSVITHMTPSDAGAILSILRNYAKPETVLIFSALIDDDLSEDFADKMPNKPMAQAVFKRAALEAIVNDNGWNINEFNPRIRGVIQPYFVCSPK